MAADPKLVVALEARLDKFESELKKAGVIAEREVKNIEDKFSKANPSLNFGQGILQGMGQELFRQLQSMPDAVRQVVAELAHLADVAQRIDLTTDALQALRFTVHQNGGELKDADAAMERFASQVGRAATESGYLAKILEANNISVKDGNGNMRNQAALLTDVAGLVAGAASHQERFTIVTEAFGRTAGPRMIETLLKIANEGLPSVINQAQVAGVVIDKELIAKAKDFDDAWNAASQRTAAYLKSWAIEVVAAFDIVVKKIQEIGRGVGTSARVALAGSGGLIDEMAWQGRADRHGPKPDPGPTKITVTPRARTVLPPRSGGGGDDKKDAIEREEDRIDKRIKLLEAETATLGMNTAAKEKARAAAELWAAAEKAGIPVTDELRAKVEALSQKWGDAAMKAETARNSFKAIEDAAKDFGSAVSDAFKGMVLEGKNLNEVLAEMTKRLASKAIDKLFDQLLFGGSGGVLNGGGILGGLLGGLGKRADGGPVSAGRTYLVGEKGPELVRFGKSGTVIPNKAMAGGGGSSGSSLVFNVSVAGEVSPATIQRLEQSLSRVAQQANQTSRAITSVAHQQSFGVTRA